MTVWAFQLFNRKNRCSPLFHACCREKEFSEWKKKQKWWFYTSMLALITTLVFLHAVFSGRIKYETFYLYVYDSMPWYYHCIHSIFSPTLSFSLVHFFFVHCSRFYWLLPSPTHNKILHIFLIKKTEYVYVYLYYIEWKSTEAINDKDVVTVG